jgi:hypothetical protein
MKFEFMEEIVCFEFLSNEFLLIVLANGEYQLIDPFKGEF